MAGGAAEEVAAGVPELGTLDGGQLLKGEDNNYFETREYMTDELKKALSETKIEAEKKAVFEKFQDEIKKLTPEELDGVGGGSQVYNHTMIDVESHDFCGERGR